MDKYSTIQQHEPLRAPSGWNADERRFIAQLEEILDDIYRRFGRLRLEDMGEKLKQWFEDADGNFSSIEQDIDDIEISVGNKYDKVSSIDITSDGIEISGGKYVKIKSGNNTAVLLDSNGIDMQTAGKAILHAQDGSGSYIIFGTDPSDANFSVGMNGDMTAKSLTVDTLMVGGAESPSVVVAEDQPTGHNILWVKPSSTAEKQWSHIPASKFLNEHDATGYYKEYTIPYNAADYLAGDLYYGAVARFYLFDTGGPYSINVTFKARLKNGSSWIDIGQVTQSLSAGGSLTLNVVMDTAAANVMDVNGGNFTLRLECNCSTQQGRLNGDALVLKAKTASASGVSACSLFYLS